MKKRWYEDKPKNSILKVVGIYVFGKTHLIFNLFFLMKFKCKLWFTTGDSHHFHLTSEESGTVIPNKEKDQCKPVDTDQAEIKVDLTKV